MSSTFEEVAATLAAAGAADRSVRIRGGGSKLGWGIPTTKPEVLLDTRGLDRIVEHNVGDLTAVLEAGVPLALAHRTFAAAGQMLALDPPLGTEAQATIGGVVATGDSGPLRHRYGLPRDLVVGMTVALSDGTISRSGGKVIKNVAGYDVPKLFAGSFGTLGVILSVTVRLHPQPVARATVLGATSDPDAAAAATRALAAAPLELDALDVAWRGGRGGVLAQLGGAEAARRGQRVAAIMREAALEHVDVVHDDERLWERQRAGQRSTDAALVRIAAPPSALAAVLRAAEACGGTLVGRAALGTSFIDLDPGAVATLRDQLPQRTRTVVLDGPPQLREGAWGTIDAPALVLMERVKQRFDPSGVCNPGVFVGGI